MCTVMFPDPDPLVVGIRVGAAVVFTGAALHVSVGLIDALSGRGMTRARQNLIAAAVATTIAVMVVWLSWLLRDPHYIWIIRPFRPVLFSVPIIVGFLTAWRVARQPAWMAAICAPAAAAGGWAGLLMAMDWTRHL